MNNSLSIVIPFYNGEIFLSVLLKSLFESYKSSEKQLNIEIIIIVDSPESNTGLINKVVDSFNFCKMQLYVNKKNIGVAKSRDLGISIAKGKYITFIDQDDYVTSSYFSVLEKQLDFSFDLLIQNGFIKNIISSKKIPIFYFKPKLTIPIFVIDNQIPTPSLLIINRSFILQNRIHFALPFNDYKGIDDWYFILQIIIMDKEIRLKWVNEYNINYCIHTSNYSNNVFESISGSICLLNYMKTVIPNYNILIEKRIEVLKFMLKYYSNNKIRTILNNPLEFKEFMKQYLVNINRSIRFFHRILIGLKVRFKS